MNKKLHLISLGCNKNLVDSEVMLGKLKAYDLTQNPVDADVLIVNTCGFIGPAKEESINTILSLHEKRKQGSILVVSGCLSQRYKDELIKELPEVDLFTGVGDYDQIDKIIDERKNRFSPITYLIENGDRVITGSNVHAFIKLSEGCNQECSFCAIPTFKGKLRSRTLRSVVSEVKNLVTQGFYDFSFISQDSSSYMRDLKIKDGLVMLIEEIEKIKGIKSARILYLYPTTTSNELLYKIIDSPIFHNYFDMPIQHINDNILKIMKRGANKTRIKEQLQIMKNAPDSFLRTSFIIGHPHESEEQFNELLDFSKEFLFDRVNIFAYSDEEDTSAYEMDGKIPLNILEERISKIEKVLEKNSQKNMSKYLNKKVKLVIEAENSESELFIGARVLNWAPEIDGEVLINESEIGELKIGELVEAVITQIAGDKLLATVTKKV